MTRVPKKSVNPYEEDPREVVAVIPPGCSLDQVQALMEQLRVCVPGHELHMQNQTGGGFAIFWYSTQRDTSWADAPTVIAEAVDPNMEIEVGDDEGPLFAYPSTEPDDMVKGFAANLQRVLDSYAAANYVTTTLTTPDDQKYSLTLQRMGNEFETPAEKIAAVQTLHTPVHVCVNADGRGATDYAADDEDYEPCPTFLAVSRQRSVSV